jgi:hypothetical protein
MADMFGREINVCAARAESVEEKMRVVECARDRARRALGAIGRFNPDCFDRVVESWTQLIRKVESGELTRQQADNVFRLTVITISDECA